MGRIFKLLAKIGKEILQHAVVLFELHKSIAVAVQRLYGIDFAVFVDG
jgi:hypothetical protein